MATYFSLVLHDSQLFDPQQLFFRSPFTCEKMEDYWNSIYERFTIDISSVKC